MEIPIITIGNSKGIRLPKSILEQYDIKESLEIILEKGRIILKPSTQPRKGWEKSFKKRHEKGDDKILINDFLKTKI